MCLHVWGSKKKAKKDIICYKVLSHYEGDLYLYSIFHAMAWEIGKTYYAENADYEDKVEINEGYYHTYSVFPVQHLNPNTVRPDVDVYKCVIPKGTWYYAGVHSDGNQGYASKSLKIVKRIGSIDNISNVSK